MQKKCAFVLSLLVVAMTLPCQAQSASEQEENKTVARAFSEEVIGQGKLKGIPTSIPPTLWATALSVISLWRKIWRRRGRTQSVPRHAGRDQPHGGRGRLSRGALDDVGHEHSAGNGASSDRQTDQDFRNDSVSLQGGEDLGRMERLEHALGAEAGRATVPSQRTCRPRAESSDPRSNQPINLSSYGHR